MIDELRNVDIEGFFPTPDAAIDMMLAAADMRDGQTVLEPSAGIGSICDRVKQAFPHTDLDAVELRDSLAKILVAKGHAVVGRDFTAWNGTSGLTRSPITDHRSPVTDHRPYAGTGQTTPQRPGTRFRLPAPSFPCVP